MVFKSLRHGCRHGGYIVLQYGNVNGNVNARKHFKFMSGLLAQASSNSYHGKENVKIGCFTVCQDPLSLLAITDFLTTGRLTGVGARDACASKKQIIWTFADIFLLARGIFFMETFPPHHEIQNVASLINSI